MGNYKTWKNRIENERIENEFKKNLKRIQNELKTNLKRIKVQIEKGNKSPKRIWEKSCDLKKSNSKDHEVKSRSKTFNAKMIG